MVKESLQVCPLFAVFVLSMTGNLVQHHLLLVCFLESSSLQLVRQENFCYLKRKWKKNVKEERKENSFLEEFGEAEQIRRCWPLLLGWGWLIVTSVLICSSVRWWQYPYVLHISICLGSQVWRQEDPHANFCHCFCIKYSSTAVSRPPSWPWKSNHNLIEAASTWHDTFLLNYPQSHIQGAMAQRLWNLHCWGSGWEDGGENPQESERV